MVYAVVVHPSKEAGYWSEVPSLPGCASQGPSLDAVLANTRAAIQQWVAYLQATGGEGPGEGDLVITLEVGD